MGESPDASDTDDAAELKPGTEVGGYVVDGKIGIGGMGVVYGARHPRIGKRVAIKVLSPTYSANASTVRRFEQEAQVVNQIKHPNIVDVFQFGELPDGRSYFVMEWLDGEPLSAHIDRGPLSAAETMVVLDVVCDALEAAHEHGVVHRDLKADNVFLAKGRKSSTVKLLDFGLAKLAGKNDLSSVNRTRSGVIVGTPAYMAPEQARGKTVDARTDIYALGVLAYKMLTGAMPFKADNAMDLIVLHMNAPVPSPSKLARDTPPELAKLVVRMMAKAPEQRPTLPEVRKVFASLRESRVSEHVAPPRRRATSVLIGAMMFLAGVIALGAIWLVQRNSDEPASSPAAEPTVTATATEVAPAPPSAAPDPAVAVPNAAAAVPAGVNAVAPVEEQPMIEFEPDQLARGSGAKRRRVEVDAGLPIAPPLPVVRPGSLILVLETASSIEIDGVAVSTSSKGGRFEVTPGTHEIRVKAPGRQPVARTFEVEAGGTAVLRIDDDTGTPAAEGSAAP
jgi:hypothetical protein